jgi:hypothetical protein
MSTVCLIYDLNDMIIDKFIHDYPTFRRFLLTIGNDRAQIAHYIRKYMKRFFMNEFSMNQHMCYISRLDKPHIIRKKVTKNGIAKHIMVVINDSFEVPFFEGIDELSFDYELKNLTTTRAYSHIEVVEIFGEIAVSPRDFVLAFPNIRKILCSDIEFIDKVLALNSKIKKIIWTCYSGMKEIIPLKYPNVEFITSLIYSEIKTGPIVKNMKCSLSLKAQQLNDVGSINMIVEKLHIIVDIEDNSVLVIPKIYKDLRFLCIDLTYNTLRNVDIVIDGFPLLEEINIKTRCKNKAKCTIVNVPYILFLNLGIYYDVKIDHETVSIFECINQI